MYNTSEKHMRDLNVFNGSNKNKMNTEGYTKRPKAMTELDYLKVGM